MRIRTLLSLLPLAPLVLLACGEATPLAEDEPVPTCVPGAQAECTCDGTDAGFQTCTFEGFFSACHCQSGVGGAGSSSSGAGTTSSAGSSSGGTGGSSSSSATSSTASTGSGAPPVEPIVLDVEARHLIADPAQGVFYATVGGAAAQYANSLVTIDPSGVVLGSVFVGSDPWTMALSDDQSTLWVSLRGSYEIRRVDLSSGVQVRMEEHALPPDAWGDLAYAGPMVALPNTTKSLGISLHREGVSPSYAGTIIVDDGVARAVKTAGHTGASRLTAGPDGWLFGFNNLHTGFGFYPLSVTASGVTSTEFDDLVSGFSTDITFAGDRVFATSGEVVDVSVPSAPTKAGTFAYSGAALHVSADGAEVLMLSVSFGTDPTLRWLDPQTFTQLGSVTYSGLTNDDAVDLVSTDGEALAFSTGEGFNNTPQVVLLQNPFN